MVITANVEFLEEEETLEPRLLESLKGIGNATQRAADLTRQLLAFSRKQALRPQPTNINDLVAATGKLPAAHAGRAYRDRFHSRRRAVEHRYRPAPNSNRPW